MEARILHGILENCTTVDLEVARYVGRGRIALAKSAMPVGAVLGATNWRLRAYDVAWRGVGCGWVDGATGECDAPGAVSGPKMSRNGQLRWVLNRREIGALNGARLLAADFEWGSGRRPLEVIKQIYRLERKPLKFLNYPIVDGGQEETFYIVPWPIALLAHCDGRDVSKMAVPAGCELVDARPTERPLRAYAGLILAEDLVGAAR